MFICMVTTSLGAQDVGFKYAGNVEDVVNEYFNRHFPDAVCTSAACMPAALPLSCQCPEPGALLQIATANQVRSQQGRQYRYMTHVRTCHCFPQQLSCLRSYELT